MKVGVKTVTVDTLNGIGIEWNAEVRRYPLTYCRGEVEPVRMAAPWCGYYGPVFRIADKPLNEVAGSVGKLGGYLGRLLNLAERYADLGSSELREIGQGAEIVQYRPAR